MTSSKWLQLTPGRSTSGLKTAAARLSALALVCGVAACSSRETSANSSTSRVQGVTEEDGCAVKIVEPNTMSREEYGASGGSARRVVYLNRHGGTYRPGREDSSRNVSGILSGTVTIPAYAEGEASWTAMKNCVRAEFARWDLEITDVDPGATPHIEAVIGGGPDELDLGSNVGGVAPMARDGSVIDRAVAYVFPDTLRSGGAEKICEVVAHEVGHTLGLEHAFLCKDPMTYLSGCGHKTFQDVAALCGESSARSCRGGRQNSVKHLDSHVGLKGSGTTPPVEDEPKDPEEPAEPTPPPAPTTPKAPPLGDPGGDEDGGDGEGDSDETETAPVLSSLSPADAVELKANSIVTVSSKIASARRLSHVRLVWEQGATVNTFECGIPKSGVTCATDSGLVSFRVPAGVGSRTWSIVATDDQGHATTSPRRTLSLLESKESPTLPRLPPTPTDGDEADGDQAEEGVRKGRPVARPAESLTLESPREGAKVEGGDKLRIVVQRVVAPGKRMDATSKVVAVWTSSRGEQRFELRNVGKGRYETTVPIAEGAKPGARGISIEVRGSDGSVKAGPKATIRVR